jgi:hypothetical protein
MVVGYDTGDAEGQLQTYKFRERVHCAASAITTENVVAQRDHRLSARIPPSLPAFGTQLA